MPAVDYIKIYRYLCERDKKLQRWLSREEMEDDFEKAYNEIANCLYKKDFSLPRKNGKTRLLNAMLEENYK
jgi:hypothetical protein